MVEECPTKCAMSGQPVGDEWVTIGQLAGDERAIPKKGICISSILFT